VDHAEDNHLSGEIRLRMVRHDPDHERDGLPRRRHVHVAFTRTPQRHEEQKHHDESNDVHGAVPVVRRDGANSVDRDIRERSVADEGTDVRNSVLNAEEEGLLGWGSSGRKLGVSVRDHDGPKADLSGGHAKKQTDAEDHLTDTGVAQYSRQSGEDDEKETKAIQCGSRQQS
jgi:hypothetical protein